MRRTEITINATEVEAYELWCALAELVQEPAGYRVLDIDEPEPSDQAARWWGPCCRAWHAEGMCLAHGDSEPVLLWALPIRTAGLVGLRLLAHDEHPLPTDRTIDIDGTRVRARRLTDRERASLARRR